VASRVKVKTNRCENSNNTRFTTGNKKRNAQGVPHEEINVFPARQAEVI
jgi:hypothetical protein